RSRRSKWPQRYGRQGRMMMRYLVVLAALLGALVASAQLPTSFESGRDVGDGQVLYPIPYDPTSIREVTFVAPSVEHPFFEIVLPLGDWTEGASASISRIRVN